MLDMIQWLNTHPQFAGFVTFIISAAESIAIIGTIVPGSITMTAIGALVGAGVIPFWDTMIWAILGAIAGDGVSYWIGYHFKDRLPYLWPFNRHPNLLSTGERFFIKYGGMSVFIGRFVGPVRALVPLVAGMLGMHPWKFIFANVASAIGWAPAYMLPGIVLGAAALELPSDIAMHVILVLLLMTLLILLCLWFIYKLLQLIHNQTTHLQDVIWHRLQGNRLGIRITYLLKHHDSSRTHGQLNLAIYLFIILVLLATLITYVRVVGPQHIFVNEAVFHLFRGLRYPQVDTIMIFITMLGQKQIILSACLLLTFWLFYQKRPYAAIHVFALALLASISILGLKYLIKIPRPWGLLDNSDSFSMPSGHSTLAIAIYMGFAFFIANTMPSHRRKYVYACGLLIAFLVGISRLYLGAHWFTDIIGGWLLGAAVLIVVIISYERKQTFLPPTNNFIIATFSSILICFAIFYGSHAKVITQSYQPLEWPYQEYSMETWWQNQQQVVPIYNASIFGFPTQKINLVWAGRLDDIENTLYKEGWSKPPARDLISTLHRIADVSSTEYLPLISPLYLDKSPALTLIRRARDQRSLLVIRLWNAHRSIKNKNLSVWVGIVGTIPRPYGWIFGKHQGELVISPTLLFPVNRPAAEWQWKLVNHTIENKRPVLQHLLFIRPRK